MVEILAAHLQYATAGALASSSPAAALPLLGCAAPLPAMFAVIDGSVRRNIVQGYLAAVRELQQQPVPGQKVLLVTALSLLGFLTAALQMALDLLCAGTTNADSAMNGGVVFVFWGAFSTNGPLPPNNNTFEHLAFFISLHNSLPTAFI